MPENQGTGRIWLIRHHRHDSVLAGAEAAVAGLARSHFILDSCFLEFPRVSVELVLSSVESTVACRRRQLSPEPCRAAITGGKLLTLGRSAS